MFANVGGNSNNDAIYGAFTVNLNNTASNANWNNGTCQSYSCMRLKIEYMVYSGFL